MEKMERNKRLKIENRFILKLRWKEGYMARVGQKEELTLIISVSFIKEVSITCLLFYQKSFLHFLSRQVVVYKQLWLRFSSSLIPCALSLPLTNLTKILQL